ncbi:hypothetical protein JD844_019176 [Phrynosoma platyrhinos]|uniref:uridine/cytidine kinase n=1 Tax=Phrynosoma platyrhinos TaxID=52577 RepID=A0ABQ7SPL1_PHRPL|nr:hypothetical protein JD844_019176 [Phrynosoma platyrhinos]
MEAVEHKSPHSDVKFLDVVLVAVVTVFLQQVLTKEQQQLAASNDYNFDHPDAFDFDLIISTLKKLKQGKSVKIPIYDFTTHSRKKEWKTLYGANVIIFEGIMAFADKELLKLLDMKIFVDTDSDIRLVRRLRRDITERGRDIEGVIKQYNKFRELSVRGMGAEESSVGNRQVQVQEVAVDSQQGVNAAQVTVVPMSPALSSEMKALRVLANSPVPMVAGGAEAEGFHIEVSEGRGF